MAQDNLQSQSDQELEFKKRARRRLVGSVALVLLMIIALPMILQDRTAKTPKQDVVVSIPSQDQGLEPEVAPAPIQQASPEPAPVAAEQKAAENKPAEPSAPLATNDKPATPIETPKQELAKAPEPKIETPKPESVKAEVKAPVSGNYFVQIGVFSDPDNVKQMQDKLSAKGLKTRADLIDTAKGKKTRLRVGPFADKKEAESALEKTKSLNLTGMIVSAS
jgi:DedD protein